MRRTTRCAVKTVVCVLALLLLLAGVTSCGAGGDNYSTLAPGDSGYDEEILKDDMVGTDTAADTVTDNRKIIEKVNLTVETKTFDALLDGVYAQIEALGGYVENSDISGNGFGESYNRTAQLTVRIPAENSDAFSSYISQNSVVTRRYVTTEDVTLKYVDMESRLSALKTERASLEALLADAATVEEVITVRDRLTQVIGEIESYTAQLRTLENLVSYATMSLTVYEVEKTTVVEEQSAGTRIVQGFSENLQAVGEGFVELFVWALSSLPFLIPMAVIAAIVVTIVLLAQRAHKKKEAARTAKRASAVPQDPSGPQE